MKCEACGKNEVSQLAPFSVMIRSAADCLRVGEEACYFLCEECYEELVRVTRSTFDTFLKERRNG